MPTKKLPGLAGLSVDEPVANHHPTGGSQPLAGDLTSVALLNTHESMRGDAEADLVSQPKGSCEFSLFSNLGRMRSFYEFLGLLSKL